jgi:hypothetical protein
MGGLSDRVVSLKAVEMSLGSGYLKKAKNLGWGQKEPLE